MPSFCPECGNDQIVCQSCGRIICSNGCNGGWEVVDTPVAHGNYCRICLGGMTEIHEKLREYSRSIGYRNVLVMKSPEAVDREIQEEKERLEQAQLSEQEKICRDLNLKVVKE